MSHARRPALRRLFVCTLAACAGITSLDTALASSHREAPFITTSPKVDGTDFYMFMSYEAGRSGYVTLIANYQPLQDAYGGPNYFKMDPNALYEIHVDNNGDAVEDLTFQFRFNNTLANNGKGVELAIGNANVAIPLTQAGAVSTVADGHLNVAETYSVKVVRGDRRKGTVGLLTKVGSSTSTLEKPVDYIGDKTLGNSTAYENYAQQHVHTVTIPGCSMPAKVFVGQRQDGFAVNLGPIFDLVNATPAQILNPDLKNAFAANSIQDKNVTTLALEVHKSCLTSGSDPVIGGWTTASMRQARLLDGSPASGLQTTDKAGGAWVQVSRLGNPLVNEVVIGLRDKDKFNASKPKDDLQFATYVTNPTLPALLGLVLVNDTAGLAPTNLPRTDLVSAFLTGITGLNRPANLTAAADELRLNTAVAPVAEGSQNRLGAAGAILAAGSVAGATDLAGFPNGRRPKDDVVDIALVAMVGGLCAINESIDLGLSSVVVPKVGTLTSTCTTASLTATAKAAGSNGLPNAANVHDGVDQAQVPFLTRFPYLNTPNSGSTPKQ
ncbi:MAG: DUF4331 domain-containing protein [Aquabacterium sp.]|uniref:DUF4331 domain-containing protein n=1 Tax=Aquabacterium sp. TaxID=1872578 RepID=UPI0025C13DF6|nr:DUF4331 domain-containing protein [Aquabacterium sp.]MBI3382095.1 DUF4331 domain-containing protein [Aquabacterium sp.]